MIATVLSVNDIPIRLTEERWAHISQEHAELIEKQASVLETVAYPLRIYAGSDGELLAVREVEAGKMLVVVYREFEFDGFVITAFLTRRVSSLARRQQVWPL